MAQAQNVWAINWWKNRGSLIYRMDKKNKVDKMFIIWLPKQSAEQAIWQASENESLIGSRKQKDTTRVAFH